MCKFSLKKILYIKKNMTERDFREKELGLILSEDGTLKFDFMTSLEKIALAKVASLLWMNQNFQQELVNVFHFVPNWETVVYKEEEFVDAWYRLKGYIISKASQLCLPDSITELLIKTIRVLANFIVVWVQYYDGFNLYSRKNCNYSAVHLISQIEWTARGKIDLAKTAKNILVNLSDSLSDDQMYKIACTHCLEDEIAILAPKVLNQYYLDSVDIGTFPMVYFWTTHITGDNTKLYYHYIEYADGGMSINAYIMLLLLKQREFILFRDNTVSLTYMWKKLSEQEKTLFLILLFKLGDQDLQYSVLSNLDYEQQQCILKKCSESILVGILNDWLWEEHFLPITLHVLEIMSPQCCDNVFHAIIAKMREKYRYEKNYKNYLYNQHKYFLKKLWQNCSRQVKDYIFGPDGNQGFVIFSLSWTRDFDVIDLIFKDVNNAQQKKTIIFSAFGIMDCVSFIQAEEYDELELFMKYTLSSEEDIIELKETLIRDKGVEIARSFLDYEEFDKIERFMIWAFKSEEDMDHFRQSLAYKEPIESVYERNKVDFTKMENQFKWCAKGDLGLINKFKFEILWYHSGKFIKKLIKNDQYELLDQVLNWCCLSDQQQIAQFKCNIYKNNFSSVREFYELLIENDDSFKKLDKFVGWSFTNEQQVQEFKTTVLHPQRYESYSCVCTYLLEIHLFELADKFIKWCGISSEAESIFKNALMLHNDIFHFFIREAEYYLQKLIKWFNPSEETVQKLKEILEGEFKRQEITDVQLNIFLKLLDEFIESQNILIAGN